MNPNQKRLKNALTKSDGEPVDLTKIEIEILPTCLRWHLWEGERRIYSAPARTEDIDAMLQATKVLCQAMFAKNGSKQPS